VRQQSVPRHAVRRADGERPRSSCRPEWKRCDDFSLFLSDTSRPHPLPGAHLGLTRVGRPHQCVQTRLAFAPWSHNRGMVVSPSFARKTCHVHIHRETNGGVFHAGYPRKRESGSDGCFPPSGLRRLRESQGSGDVKSAALRGMMPCEKMPAGTGVRSLVKEGMATASTEERLLDGTGSRGIRKKLLCFRGENSAPSPYSPTEHGSAQAAWHSRWRRPRGITSFIRTTAELALVAPLEGGRNASKRISVDPGRWAEGTVLWSCWARSSKCPSHITPGLVRGHRLGIAGRRNRTD
jgi:hypothetical protein